MLIRSIIMPANKLITLSTKDTAQKAVQTIEENGFLSLPVFEDKKFVGFLSKQFVYDEFFKSGETDYNKFFQKPVAEFITTPLEALKDSTPVEEAAEIFFKSKVRFLPVVDSDDRFLGILTQKVLFDIIIKVFGLKDAKLVILASDFSGVIAKISEIIYKNGANITNIVQMDTGVMEIKEISIRLEGDGLEKIVEKLKNNGVKIREFIPSK
ncbi:acetoin utilization protein AcuB [Sedimentibacter acidaminivorans]|uniref:Acetoin utilization protein AcuB n=1 Tax=Sedimentibacter acidaminivorans TaxID=913099 RepID=A0ABS4GBK3_9FIRM|nr:CBS domain-containing protein [Sedimentibacter acidaminivorans]MBP1925076.1 acetoin utilization protein AcuB [Sedimentibacter acidaminivorans]